LADFGALNNSNILIGGDLNLTLSLREVWGAILDRTRRLVFFSAYFEKHHLIDIELVKIVVPSWRNFQTNKGAVSKRLDGFLVSEPMMNNNLLMKSYASTEDLSDHFSILFNLDSGGESPPTPSKFNQVWLTKDDYEHSLNTNVCILIPLLLHPLCTNFPRV
jgi:hypothetical protein